MAIHHEATAAPDNPVDWLANHEHQARDARSRGTFLGRNGAEWGVPDCLGLALSSAD
jgi:hypothetical protein